MSILYSNLTDERIKNLILEIKWYHTIEFPNNIITNGVFDHRPFIKKKTNNKFKLSILN